MLLELDRSLDVIIAEDCDLALTPLARHPDRALLLLDLLLPGAHGLDLLGELVRDHPRLPIIVLWATHHRATVGAALAAGARGYVAKTASPSDLLDAIRTVLAGGCSVKKRYARAPAHLEGITVAALGLTERQADVLRLLCRASPTSRYAVPYERLSV
jgi:DNA-binding NarL/FixJ family response regulator